MKRTKIPLLLANFPSASLAARRAGGLPRSDGSGRPGRAAARGQTKPPPFAKRKISPLSPLLQSGVRGDFSPFSPPKADPPLVEKGERGGFSGENSFDADLGAEIESARLRDLYRKLRVFHPDSNVLVFADNDYLGLSEHPEVIRAFQKAAAEYGVGARASRLISGTSDLHEQLEERIAQFKRKEKALVFTTGYMANLGILTALCGKEDLIVMDKLNHASLIDAARLSGAAFRVYPHKNLHKLEAILKRAGSFRRKSIVTDGVFSMDGDLAPLAELVELKERYGAILMVDEAHAIGVFGQEGRGVAEALGVEDRVDILMGTLSKAIGGLGGFVASSQLLIDYLINFSRPFLFATALPPALCAAALEALRIIEAEPERREKLWENVRCLKRALEDLGFALGPTESPILPLMVGDEAEAVRFSNWLWEEGVYIPAIRYPTVGRGQARLRLTVSAKHSKEDMDRLITTLKRVKRGSSPPFSPPKADPPLVEKGERGGFSEHVKSTLPPFYKGGIR